MQGYEIKFNIYANSEAEVQEARNSIIAFINQHARQGRAVSANKIAKAVGNWDKNPLIKNEIIKYFS